MSEYVKSLCVMSCPICNKELDYDDYNPCENHGVYIVHGTVGKDVTIFISSEDHVDPFEQKTLELRADGKAFFNVAKNDEWEEVEINSEEEFKNFIKGF